MAAVESIKSSPRPNRKPFVPDGIVHHRRLLQRRGNLIAALLMVSVTIIGLLWGRMVSGATGGLGGFAILTLAMPFLPIFGAPTSGTGTKYALAFLCSFVLWGGLGIVATRRALLRPIATWREWLFEFVPLALAVVAGVGMGLAITAISVL